MPNCTAFRPGMEDQLNDKFKLSYHGFQLEMIEEERYSLKLIPQSVLLHLLHGTIKWRNSILGYSVLEETNLQAHKTKISTHWIRRKEQNFILMTTYFISAPAVEITS